MSSTHTNFSTFWISVLLALVISFGATYIAQADDTDTGAQTDTASAGVNENAAPQEEVATSSDGTGGQSGVGGTVITGNATASTSVDNQLNTNTININNTPEECAAEPDKVCDTPGSKMNQSSTTASSTNAGILDSSASTSAQTGENIAQGDEGAALVVTGDAMATADVINVINTNIFNSQGLVLFINRIFGGVFDLRNWDLSFFLDGNPGGSPAIDENGNQQCTLLTCLNASQLNVYDTNTATVTNDVIVRAGTGLNVATTSGQGPEADAMIATGNAYAAANVFNLINTNIINSSYLLLAFNNFGTMEEDIILPDNEFFEELFAESVAGIELNASTYTATSSNTVDFTGTTTVLAETGDNVASSTGEGNGVVVTGDGYSSATNYTQANTTYVGGTSVLFYFQVWGNFDGDVLNIPNGIIVAETPSTQLPDGNWLPGTIAVVSDPNAMAAGVVGEYNLSSFLASSTNKAAVENNIDVAAQTGGNYAEVASGTAEILSGDAYAVANAVNLINTNVVGRNWIFGVFNIFGDMDGDITFGDKPNVGEVFEEGEVVVGNGGGSGGGGGGGRGGGGGSAKTFKVSKNAETFTKKAGGPNITVVKTATLSTTTPLMVDYKIVVTNAKDAAEGYDGILTDTLVGPDGSIMFERAWGLDTIVPGDEITLTYSVQFSATTTPGAYTNTARVDSKTYNAKPYQSRSASQIVHLSPGGVVLGASTIADSCTPAIGSFLRRGMTGGEVTKLQTFLNSQGNALPLTGFYGPMTAAAVNKFQLAYAAEILAPLGLTQPTGSVYASTLKKINSFSCGDVAVAPAPVVSTPAPVAAKPKAPAPVAKAPAPAAPEAPVLAPTPAPQPSSWVSWLGGLLPF